MATASSFLDEPDTATSFLDSETPKVAASFLDEGVDPAAIQAATKDVVGAALGPGSLAYANSARDSFNQDQRERDFFTDPAPAERSNLSGLLDEASPTMEGYAGAAAIGEGYALDNPAMQTADDITNAYNTPLVSLPKPEGTGVISGAARGAVNLLEGLTTPLNIGLLGVGAGLPVAAQKLMAGGFAAHMASALPEQYKGIVEAADEGDPGKAAERAVETLGAIAMTALAGTHAASRTPAGRGTRPQSLTQEGADLASVRKQIRDLQEQMPNEPLSKDSQRPVVPDTIDGLVVTRNRLARDFAEQPDNIRTERQAAIDEIDEQLLRFAKDDVQASEARVRAQEQSSPPVSATEPVQSTGGPSTTGGRSARFEQAKNEIDPRVARLNEQLESQKTPEAVLDDALVKSASESAERIADQVTKGQPTSVRDAARDAALDNAMSSMRNGESPSTSFMRKSAQEAAGRAAERTGESLDAPVREGETTTIAEQTAAPETRNNSEIYSTLNSVIDESFSPRDAAIIRAVQEGSLESVGQQYGLSKQRVGQIIKDSLPKIKKALEERGITQADYVGGPGAMGPIEALEMKLKSTGTKNATVAEERALRGEEEILREEPVSNRQSIEEARQVLEKDPARADVIVEELNNSARDVRTISAADEAILMAQKVDLMKQRVEQETIYGSGDATPEQMAVAAQRLTEIEQKLNQVDQATYASGAEWGRMGQLRQRLLRQDYSLESMERRARIQKGEALTPEETAKIKQQSDKIQELQTKLEEVQKRQSESESTKASEESFSDIVKKSQESPESKFAPRVLALAESIVTRLDTAADAARKRITERLKNASAGLDPTVVYDVAVIGTSKLARASLSFAKWSAEMTKELGDWVQPYLAEAWKESERIWKAEEQRLNPSDKPELARVRKKVAEATDQAESTTAQIAERAKAGEKPEDLRGLVQRLALETVRAGEKTRDGLIDKVHSVVEKAYPEMTREQTRDLISGYGDFKALDKDAAKTTLRGLKGEMQQIGKIEDMQAKQAPKKTGVERRTPTDEERRLLKEVNELKKKGGFQVQDPATQLKTALDAVKTRLNNEIRDLDVAIQSKERITPKKNVLEYDAETKALQERRDLKRAEYDALFPKEPLTDAQMLDRVGKALDRSISELESDIKAGRLYGEKSQRKLTSPEIEAKKARLEALRAQREELRASDTVRNEANREKQLQAAIDRASSAVKPNPKASTVDSQRVSELKKQLSDIREAKANSPEAMAGKLEKAAELARKQISELDRRIREGDITPKKGQEQLRSNELDALRSERDALSAFIQEQRNALKPKLSPEELALKNYKTRTANRIAELQEKIANQDFAPKVKKDLKLDKEALDLKAQIETVKEKYNEDLLKHKLAQRTMGQKIIGGVSETINTARAILTSLDFSAVLRQGGFVAFGNPIRAARALPDMFRAALSPHAQKRINAEISMRDNAKSGLYDKAKLYLADTGAKTLSKMEEDYLGRWSKKIPLVAGSERAYTTFLNRIRADTFDAMLKSLGSKEGVSLDEAKAIANFVNVATGRGGLGKFETSGSFLSTVFFSPRYVASRFQLMAGSPMYGGSARTRTAIAKEYAKFLTGIALVYAMGKLAGAKIEDDPRSSDFGKMRFGNTRVDPMGGILQNTVLLSRIASGETKQRGNVVPIRGDNVPFKGDSTSDIMARFVRTKFSPVIGAAVDLASGENVMGQKTTPSDVAKNFIVPMSLKDVYKNMLEQGVPAATAQFVLSIFGLGIQNYGK